MKSKITISFVLILHFVIFSALGSLSAQEQKPYLLPWQAVTAEYEQKFVFCTRTCAKEQNNQDESEDGRDFALEANASYISLPLKVSDKAALTETAFSKWQENQWQNLPEPGIKHQPEELLLDSAGLDDGFYRLSLVFTEDNNSQKHDFYAIVADNWKKDLLTFCRYYKEQIEIDPDPQLIYSSIAVSHFDHVMELASEASALSKNILDALNAAVKSKQAFEEGRCPDFVIGGLTRISVRRFAGAEVAGFLLCIPDDYTDGKKWPLLVFSNTNDNPRFYPIRPGMIGLNWYYSGMDEYDWPNYKAVLEIIKNKLSIDEKRIYLQSAACASGAHTMKTFLLHPDEWAGCRLIYGSGYYDLAENAYNLPFIYHLAHNDPSTYFTTKCFEYRNCRSFVINEPGEIHESYKRKKEKLLRQVKDKEPERVLLKTHSHATAKAHWVEISGRKDENFAASIDAAVCSQNVLLQTKNVDAYSLNLELAPIDHSRPVKIIENGKSLGFTTEPVFTRKSQKYENAVFIKNKHIHGPVSDVFTAPYVVVWPSSGESEQVKIYKDIAKLLAGSGPCLADVNLPDEFIETHNIVLVGRHEDNPLLARIADKLPVTLQNSKLTFDGLTYEGNLGVILIHPNPLNPEKYVTVFSGASEKAMAHIKEAWSQLKAKGNVDVGIFKVENDQIKWMRLERLNAIWDWHENWNTVLTQTNKEHPKWQWRQWIARALRKQLKADVLISDGVFESSKASSADEITLRDLSRIFKNDWIVTVSVKGGDLKELLMTAFNHNSSGNIYNLVIDGISTVKVEENSIGNEIYFNDLENEKEYMLAISHNTISSKKIGDIIKSYKILDDGYLVLLLKDYLCYRDIKNLDDELDNIKRRMFL